MKNNSSISEKENFWEKIKKWFTALFNKNNRKLIQEPKTEYINVEKKEFNTVIKENEIIKNAKNAFENYILNDEVEVAEHLYDIVKERIEINKDSIEKLIEIKRVEISYEKILKILTEEKRNLEEYKKTIRTTKIDTKFLFSEYQVPVGIIGIQTDDIEEKIRNIFKAITTRNAIIVIEEKEDSRNIDKLILLIVKEALNKLNIDENIIQIITKEDITKEDMKEFDLFINKSGKIIKKNLTEKMYIYQEDEYFSKEVQEEVKRLKLSGKIVEVLIGEKIDTIIYKLNKSKNFAVSIYSKDRKKGYKFVNLVRSQNVFFNGTLLNAKQIEKNNNDYFTVKNLLCENIMM